MHITPFSVSRLPRIEFGAGVLNKLPTLARTFGTRALLVTGAQQAGVEAPPGMTDRRVIGVGAGQQQAHIHAALRGLLESQPKTSSFVFPSVPS